MYHNNELWIKKGVSGNFVNPMGFYDSAMISELVWCLLLYKRKIIIHSSCHWLYQDDRLIRIDNCAPRKGDIIKKKQHCSFIKFEFKLDIQSNLFGFFLLMAYKPSLVI